MEDKLVIHTEVEKVEFGAITALTLKVMNEDECIYRASFDITEEGDAAVLKTDFFAVEHDRTLRDQCKGLIVGRLKEHGVGRIVENTDDRMNNND